jgi:hypothetical protein
LRHPDEQLVIPDAFEPGPLAGGRALLLCSTRLYRAPGMDDDEPGIPHIVISQAEEVDGAAGLHMLTHDPRAVLTWVAWLRRVVARHRAGTGRALPVGRAVLRGVCVSGIVLPRDAVPVRHLCGPCGRAWRETGRPHRNRTCRRLYRQGHGPSPGWRIAEARSGVVALLPAPPPNAPQVG